jgi:DNA repair protein RecN (Recombination protein N)
MLESIIINNFAIIDRSHIEFEPGLTALTGETGAGKSILLDAIKLVLGDRADADAVKTGCDKADISVIFDVSQLEKARQWLKDNDLDDGDECLLRRVVQSGGRSKAYLNGAPVTLTQMREIGEMLVDIHGQHEHQSLQKPGVQRQMLDAKLPDHALIANTREAYREWKRLNDQLRSAIEQSSEKQQRVDLLTLYCRELHELGLKDGELEEMEEEYNRLSHAGQLMETTASLLDSLYENDEYNIQSRLTACASELEELSDIDPSMRENSDMIQSALIQVQEVAANLRDYQDRIDLDPSRLDWLNGRLGQAQNLARKHHVKANELVQLTQDFDNELDSLQFSEQDIDKLRKAIATASKTFLEQAGLLSAARRKTANELSQQVSEVMQTLGLQGGRFEIAVDKAAGDEGDDSASYSASGLDRIQFLVSANPGQPLKPLTKVASGGELSRISLAIQVILSESSRIPTLIFDEVDSGIGGGIAEVVGRKLREIAGNRQVFCVTHLPQVASQAHHHYQVSKTKSADSTSTEVSPLDQQQRLEEIARMLGGMTITEQTRAHAREMLDNVA